MTQPITVTVEGGVATLTLDRPGKRNALTAEMWRLIPQLLDKLAADPGVRVAVLTGAGGTFSAGADLSEISRLTEGGDDTGLTVAAEQALIAFPKPVIAKIEGFCVGGGCQLALACDLRLADPGTRFGVTPAKLGLVYPQSSTRRLVDQVGPGAAKLLLYSADLFDAPWALRTGLVDELPDDLHGRVHALATTIASRSPVSLAATKEIADGRADEARFLEWQRRSRVSAAEGVAAFLEKRAPRF